jgi:hypothetical protein
VARVTENGKTFGKLTITGGEKAGQ